jgi:hypothetical protein
VGSTVVVVVVAGAVVVVVAGAVVVVVAGAVVVVAVVLQADMNGRAATTSVKARTTSKSFQPCFLIFYLLTIFDPQVNLKFILFRLLPNNVYLLGGV